MSIDTVPSNYDFFPPPCLALFLYFYTLRMISLQGRMQKQEQAGGKRRRGKQPDEMRAKPVVFHTDTDQNEKQ